MPTEGKSIREHIDDLARLTGAPDSFVIQVQDLFSRKGIPLDSDASPYVQALEEAFIREERIRTTSNRVREAMSRIHQDFSRLGKAYVDRCEVDNSASTLSTRTAETGSENAPAQATSVVLRQQSEDLPMVPGPEDLQ